MDMRKTLSNISPKTAFYFSNGTGRDSYIACNNGGMTAAKTRELVLDHGGYGQRKGSQSKNPTMDAKYFFYHSDGTGRDSYVAINSGGLHTGKLPADSRNAFVNSLRAYDQSGSMSPGRYKKPRCSSNSPKKDFLLSTMTTFSSRYMKEMKALHNYQKKLDERLSQPKFKTVACKKHI